MNGNHDKIIHLICQFQFTVYNYKSSNAKILMPFGRFIYNNL